MKKFEGKDLKEVWNYRLSVACPFIDRRGKTWVVHICANQKSDYPLESYDTGIPVEEGDVNDRTKIIKCYEWLYKVRSKYSLPDIEERKPLVAKMEAAEKALAELGAV